MEKTKFDTEQRQVLAGIIVAYTAAYVCRLNLSAALVSMASGMGISSKSVGMFPTAFAVVYAIGQFVNGGLVNRVHPVHHILLGLSGTAIINLLMGITGEFIPGNFGFMLMLMLCVMNGACQSMLWTPIVRLMALKFVTETERKRANMLVAFTMTLGHFLAWGISMLMLRYMRWTYGFFVPAFLIIPVFFVVKALFRSVKSVGMVQKIANKNMHDENPARFLALTGFPLILLGCICHGFVRDGIINWAPTILSSITTNGMVFSLVIPIINCVGIIAGNKLVKKPGGSPRRISGVLFLLGGVVSAIMCAVVQISPILAITMGTVCAAMYGMNPLMTTLIPMEYDCRNLTPITAGMIDSFIYIGSAASGILLSQIPSNIILFAVLAATSLLGAAAMYSAGRKTPGRLGA